MVARSSGDTNRQLHRVAAARIGKVVEQWSQPGKGYETVCCSYWDGPAFVELQIQRFIYTGNGG
jgi:hypothetical protein